ncbi:thiamine diphosphate-binding protein [Lasiosphaeria ovina]|uniref:Pyruvate decarboxylase n=1 Tax=Lasiosphaeria ovina TaxID=92902 RepID=A0AAE0KHI3_9PEZI|nr:thiamine diphosphate-binding protein [Lasiosphaeria ovina]
MPEILIGDYLFRRLKEIGIDTVFGVPGDFELALVDLIPHNGLQWVGTPNELVGAYAADGYARVKGAAALVTTFGPGELSALCGIGGAYCENVPVVHIVGYPTIPAQKSGKILHHTLGDGSYDHYVKISGELSCATTILKDPTTAVAEIDRVLNAMLFHSQPAYIGVSEEVAYAKVSTEYLDTPLVRALPRTPAESEAKVVAEIVKLLESAKAPVLVVDGGAARQSWAEHVNPLVDALKIPVFVTVMGKGIVNEESPYYKGYYGGAGSNPPTVRAAVEQADAVLWLGNYPSDLNTGFFTEIADQSFIVDFQRFSVKIGATKYDAKISHILPKLVAEFQSRPQLSQLAVAPFPAPHVPQLEKIEQDWLWDRLSTFLRAGDLIITETGTAQAGITATRFPAGSLGWTQAIYGSIGYAAGAAAGASVAAQQTGKYKRLVLVTGEGSLQLTVQAFAVLSRLGIPAVVLILNNSGYTIERFFCGWDAAYNDVYPWDYSAIFKALAPDVPNVRGFKTTTAAELDALLADEEFNSATYPQCVDMVMDRYDAPTAMKTLFELKAKNAQKTK